MHESELLSGDEEEEPELGDKAPESSDDEGYESGKDHVEDSYQEDPDQPDIDYSKFGNEEPMDSRKLSKINSGSQIMEPDSP